MDLVAAISQTAQRYGVDPALALAVAQKESSLDPSARGAAGEVGLYQLLPSTAHDLGVNPWDVAENIEGGIRYLRALLDRFRDVRLALMAYNAGPSRVQSGAVPASSVRYASDVLELAGAAGGPGAPSSTSWTAAASLPLPEPSAGSLWLASLLIAASLFFLLAD